MEIVLEVKTVLDLIKFIIGLLVVLFLLELLDLPGIIGEKIRGERPKKDVEKKLDDIEKRLEKLERNLD